VFPAGEAAAKVTMRKTAAVTDMSVRTKRAKRRALEPSTPIRVALAGVPRHGAFAANGIDTLEQATAYSRNELAAIPGIGPGLIAALDDALARASLELRADA
jgi:hypothetical protein